MKIVRLSLLEGAKKAEGTAVIIDVFRAFTTAAHVMANGAKFIIPVGNLEEAFEMKRLNPEWVLIGERGGAKVKGFDYGNSPYEVSRVDYSGRTVIQTTGAGTQGVVNARRADEIILGSYVMAGAVVRYLFRKSPRLVSIVALGDNGLKPSEEDELCAEYMESILEGGAPKYENMKKRIRVSSSGAKFFDPSKPQFREEDFHLSLELDRFNFILKAVKGKKLHVIREEP